MIFLWYFRKTRNSRKSNAIIPEIVVTSAEELDTNEEDEGDTSKEGEISKKAESETATKEDKTTLKEADTTQNEAETKPKEAESKASRGRRSKVGKAKEDANKIKAKKDITKEDEAHIIPGK